jgi:hypothetical protein
VVTLAAPVTWICEPCTKLDPSTSKNKVVEFCCVAVPEVMTGIGVRTVSVTVADADEDAWLTAVMLTGFGDGRTPGAV